MKLYRDGSVGAFSNYKKAISLDGRYVDAYRNLGSVYAMQQRYSEAIPLFRKALEFAPNESVLHLYLGSALRDSGNTSEAQYHLDRAKELGE